MTTIRLTQLLSFKEESPEDPFILYALASEYVKLNELEQALAYYNELREKHPNYVGTYYHLAKLLEAMQRSDEALEVYQLGLSAAQRAGDGHAYAELLAAYRGAKGEGGEEEDD